MWILYNVNIIVGKYNYTIYSIYIGYLVRIYGEICNIFRGM